MTQQDINTIKRECFPDLVKLADELEEKGYFVNITRSAGYLSLLCGMNTILNGKEFSFMAYRYDTIREANTAFQKQLKAFRKEVLDGE